MRAIRKLLGLASTLALTGCINSADHAEFLMQTAWTDHTPTAHKALHTPQHCYCYSVLGGVECYPEQQAALKGRLLTDPIVLLKAKKEKGQKAEGTETPKETSDVSSKTDSQDEEKISETSDAEEA